MFHIHIFHIFTFFIIVPLTPHYSINYYYCLFEYIGLSSLPLLAVVIYSEHFHMDSYPLVLNAALGFILGMPPFI